MPSLSKRIMQRAAALPEAAPLCPDALLHLGNRAAVNRALSGLARAGRLLRICRGVYMRPVETRFGACAPGVGKAISSLSALWGETIVPCGASAANVLGLTTQNPVLSVYLTSGPDRRLRFGRQTVRLRHAPRWQLVAPYRRAGDAVRALAWFGPREIEDALARVAPRLSADDMAELAAARATMPAWMAAPVSALAGGARGLVRVCAGRPRDGGAGAIGRLSRSGARCVFRVSDSDTGAREAAGGTGAYRPGEAVRRRGGTARTGRAADLRRFAAANAAAHPHRFRRA